MEASAGRVEWVEKSLRSDVCISEAAKLREEKVYKRVVKPANVLVLEMVALVKTGDRTGGARVEDVKILFGRDSARQV